MSPAAATNKDYPTLKGYVCLSASGFRYPIRCLRTCLEGSLSNEGGLVREAGASAGSLDGGRDARSSSSSAGGAHSDCGLGHKPGRYKQASGRFRLMACLHHNDKRCIICRSEPGSRGAANRNLRPIVHATGRVRRKGNGGPADGIFKRRLCCDRDGHGAGTQGAYRTGILGSLEV